MYEIRDGQVVYVTVQEFVTVVSVESMKMQINEIESAMDGLKKELERLNSEIAIVEKLQSQI